MLLTEQNFTNKSIIYYHGQVKKHTHETDTQHNCFFITRNFLYAVTYTKGRGRDIGVVEQYTLSRTLNLFNPRNPTDLAFLRKRLPIGNQKWEELEKHLKDKDWFQNKVIDRKNIIKTIRQLGYDGFVNWESIHKENDYFIKFPNYYNDSMSIGVFDKSVLRKVGVLEQKDFAKEDRNFVKAHNEEMNYRSEQIAIAIKDKMNKNQVMMEVFKSCPTLTWAEIKLNEDRLFSAYSLGCTFREVYNEAMNLDKKSKWQDTNDNL